MRKSSNCYIIYNIINICVCVSIRYPFSIANLPSVTTILRQHELSKSFLSRSTAVSNALEVRWRHFNACRLHMEEYSSLGEGSTATPALLLSVTHPNLIKTDTDLERCCRFLNIITAGFIRSLPSDLVSDEVTSLIQDHRKRLVRSIIAGVGEGISDTVKVNCAAQAGVEYNDSALLRMILASGFS